MNAKRPECIFFSENLLGGVQSYYHNLITHDPFNEFDKKWILVDKENTTDSRLPALYNTGFETLFTYKGDDNAYEFGKALSKLISNRPGVIMANHDIELSSLYLYPRPAKTVFFVCHDENYLPIARRFHSIIDVFVAHNIHFANRLREEFPERSHDIYYLPYGINMATQLRKPSTEGPLRLVFLARFHKNKGIYRLPVIDDLLKARNISVKWTLIGDGPEYSNVRALVNDRNNFEFKRFDHNNEVLNEIKEHDVFVLPSYLEGMPVSLLEAMSAGLVPVITRYNPGITRAVSESEGFILEMDDDKGIAEKIELLHKDRNLLNKLGSQCRKKIETDYDINKRAEDYYKLFREFKQLKRELPRQKLKFGHRLDHPLISKSLRQALRKLK